MSDRDELQAAVMSVIPPFVYRETHGAVVRLQHDDDGTLDVTCDDARIGDLTRAPFRAGIPGASCAFVDGDRVRIAFEDGEPSRFYAFAPDQDSSAQHAISREGDIVDCGILSYAGPGVLTWVDTTQTPPVPTVISGPTPIRGKISAGSSRVKLGG